jgi:hypothetical protein
LSSDTLLACHSAHFYLVIPQRSGGICFCIDEFFTAIRLNRYGENLERNLKIRALNADGLANSSKVSAIAE